MIRTILHAITVLLLLPYLSIAQTMNSSSEYRPVRNIHSITAGSIEMSYQFPGYRFDSIQIKGSIFVKPHTPDFTHLKDVGKPALPTHSDMIALPQSGDYTIEIVNIKTETLHNVNVAPARPPLRDTYGSEAPPYEIDSTFYRKDSFYPEKYVTIHSQQQYRSLNIGALQVTPFRYNPALRELETVASIRYRITFTGKTEFCKTKDLSSAFSRTAPNLVLNNKPLQHEILEKSQLAGKSEEGTDYIVVTQSKYHEAAKRLATWERQQGYKTLLVEQNNWTAALVKDTIHALYEQNQPHPDYFVIIGDHEDVPGEVLQSPTDEPFATDLYYACMNGGTDYFPDMAHGRISVSTAEEANRVIDKIIHYETKPPEDPAFYEQGSNCAQFQDDELNGYATRRFTHTSEDIRDYMILQDFDVERIYYTDANITPTHYNNGWYSNGEPIPDELLRSNGFQWDGDQNDIIDAINEGRFYIFHRDHGYAGGTGWAHPYFVKNSIDFLNNDELTPVVFSINCHTGEFMLPECFAEKFLRHSLGGAVGVFAASYYSYSGYNDGLSTGFIDAMFPEPGLIPDFGEGGINNPNVSPHDKIMTMGNVLNQGLIRMGETWGSSRYTNEIFHYFGDPAMELHTAFAGAITANNPDTIYYESQNQIEVTNASLPDGVATLVSNQNLLDSVHLENGEGVLHFDSLTGNQLLLTISRHNYKPYVDTIFIAGKPAAGFSVEEYYPCIGEVEFKNTTAFNPESFYWSFGDGATSSQANPEHTYTENGAYSVRLVAQNTFGSDTVISQQPVIINRPEPARVEDDTICDKGILTFSSQTTDDSILWYDSDTNLLAEGAVFTTPKLTETTHYLARRKTMTTNFAGKKNLNGETETGHSFQGLVFDASQSFALNSVKVYADGAGDRIIQLRDESYTILKEDTVFVESGEQRIVLDWSIQPGDGYMLVAYGDHSLKSTATQFLYPYAIEEVLSITQSTYIPDPAGYYFCFFDWEISSYSCKSTLTSFTAKVEQEPVADFDVTIGDPDITLENLSENGFEYLWDFGDGQQSQQLTPTHVYENNGTYTLRLITKNFCGKDTTGREIEIKTVGVANLTAKGWKVYPNPAQGRISILRTSEAESTALILIKDLSGRQIGRRLLAEQEHMTNINLDKLRKGLYILEIHTDEESFTLKVIKN